MKSANDSIKIQGAHLLAILAVADTLEKLDRTLDFALVAFDHHDTEQHNEHHRASAIDVVVQCMVRDTDTVSDRVMEKYVRLIALLLSRCSTSPALAAFYRVGTDLVAVILLYFSPSTKDQKLEIVVSELIGCLKDLPVLMSSVPNRDALVRTTKQVVRCGTSQAKCLMLQLLCGWTSCPHNRTYVMRLPGLVDSIVCGQCPKSRVWVLALMENLACDARHGSELMRTRGVRDLLICGLRGEEKCFRHSVTILSRLAMETSSCRLLLKEKTFISLLIDKMDEGMFADGVLLTLLRLINRDSAPMFLKKKNFVRLLEKCAQSVVANVETAAIAAQALRRLAAFVSVRDKRFPRLLMSLTSLAHDTRSSLVRLWGVRGIAAIALTSSGRFYLLRSPDVLHVLVRLARFDECSRIKSAAAEAICFMALDKANAKRVAGVQETLSALVENTKAFNTESGKLAIQAILALAVHKNSNKERVAKTIGLVEALITYGISSDRDEVLKNAALRTVAVLAPCM